MRGLLLATLVASGLTAGRAMPVEEIKSIGGLPAHLAGAFNQIAGCHITREGNYVVFDRSEHAVFAAEPSASKPRKIVQIGFEPGRVLRPMAFDAAPDGSYVVADSPGGPSRIQFFIYSGGGLGGFTLQGTEAPHITIGGTVVSGIASIEHTGDSVLLSLPKNGNLITEYSTNGRLLRSFGDLRPTGHEQDPDVHAALNAGLPLVDPAGGYYFVFVAGTPVFRKYDAKGTLVFERQVQGVEVDEWLKTLPTTWKRGADLLPLVQVSVRAAGVDPEGRLWISLAVPYTYVYDAQGDKIRIVQFRAAGIMTPTSFTFTRDKRMLVAPGCYAFPRT